MKSVKALTFILEQNHTKNTIYLLMINFSSFLTELVFI